MEAKKGMMIDSPMGKVKLDSSGSAIAVARMDPVKAYLDIPVLLKSVIDESSAEAWQKIKAKIDYMYANISRAMSDLESETGFVGKIKTEIKSGKKLLFKPNLVSPTNIDPLLHGEGLGNNACTEWPFVAALMRTFHDQLDISYHEMMIGEAASSMSMTAGYYSLVFNNGKRITTESVIEGRNGDFYGGWGFYFVRKYLAENHPTSHKDNPMNGYNESVSGTYLPPGQAGDRLMVYDLNRTYDDKNKIRTVPVPDGANFKEISLHKVLTGGDPNDPADRKNYPGCVIINVPRLKMHCIDLITNAVKNLGIGLYPMEASSVSGSGDKEWKYCFPHHMTPGMKSEIPHQSWIAKSDMSTGLPVRNDQGEYIAVKTDGMAGTQADVINAVRHQGTFIFHVVDSIQATNIDHMGVGKGVKQNEGLALMSLDPVALDVCCARYLFKTIPMAESRELQKAHTLSTDFLQKVPVVKADQTNMVTQWDFDSPLLRYHLYEYAEDRGLGRQNYYIVGWDAESGAPLASIDGHLGKADNGKFSEIITDGFYYNPGNMLWCCQKTTLSYFESHDRLTGSTHRKDLLAAFDENGDGVIDYEEQGNTGFWHPLLRFISYGMAKIASEKYGFLKGGFLSKTLPFKYINPEWNAEGHTFGRDYYTSTAAVVAYNMSLVPMDGADPFNPAMTWGNGKWPSVALATYMGAAMTIYGLSYPLGIDLTSVYGLAFQYADKRQNGGAYTGSTGIESELDAVNRYIDAVAKGTDPLNFNVYVPLFYGNISGKVIPNVVETADPEKIFTASFNDELEIW